VVIAELTAVESILKPVEGLKVFERTGAGSMEPCSHILTPRPPNWRKSRPRRGWRGFTGWKFGRNYSAGFPLFASTGASASPDACSFDPFPEIDTARKAFARLVSRKQRRGYVASVNRFADQHRKRAGAFNEEGSR
jgi:hypothetical protein